MAEIHAQNGLWYNFSELILFLTPFLISTTCYSFQVHMYLLSYLGLNDGSSVPFTFPVASCELSSQPPILCARYTLPR